MCYTRFASSLNFHIDAVADPECCLAGLIEESKSRIVLYTRNYLFSPLIDQTWDERVRVRRSSSKSSRFLFEFEFESNEMFEFEFEVRVFSTFFNAF